LFKKNFIMQKRIVITGATGLIGKKITEKLLLRGDSITAVTRNTQKAKSLLPLQTEFLEWNYNRPVNELSNIFQSADAVIHLAGENVLSKRWTKEHKQNIYNSRVISTGVIADAISNFPIKPGVFICASAIGYYGLTATEPADEYSNCGTDFLALLTKEWEDASLKLDNAGVRRVNIRTGIVLDKEEGALAKMLAPYKLFIGGPLGTGRQFFPWIHIEDVAGMYIHALDNIDMKGAYNAVAPETITMKEFCKSLGKILRRPSLFNVPGFALKLLYGEGADILLNGVNVIPERTEKSSYTFLYKTAKDALNNLL
jgi:uncharacterized protein